MAVRLASGARLHHFETIDSTNLEAKRLVAAGETGPAWLIADEQTAGYGRRGAAWRQAGGDVAASFICSDTAPIDQLSQWSFIAALGVSDAVRAFIGEGTARLEVKWPNDILIDGGKLAGILLELETQTGDQGRAQTPELAPVLVLGVGVNILSKPEGVAYAPARLMDFCAGPPPSPREFLTELDTAITAWAEIWRRSGFAPVREAWLARAARLGEQINVRLPTETFSGVFDGIDETGALLLTMGGELRTFAAGEVFFGAAAHHGGAQKTADPGGEDGSVG